MSQKTPNGTKFESAPAAGIESDNAEPVRLPLTVSKQTHKKIVARRRKLGLTHDQDLLRMIIALYFEAID